MCQKVTFWIYVYEDNLSEVLELGFLNQGRKKTSFASSHGLNTFLENIVPAVCCYSSVNCHRGSKGKKTPKKQNPPTNHKMLLLHYHFLK